jgi:hypothetical protein
LRAGKLEEVCYAGINRSGSPPQGKPPNVEFNAATLTAIYINSPHETIQTTTLTAG